MKQSNPYVGYRIGTEMGGYISIDLDYFSELTIYDSCYGQDGDYQTPNDIKIQLNQEIALNLITALSHYLVREIK